MSLGDALRGLIDPVHPAVREWLRRELPRLVAEGYVEGSKAELIARRYGVALDAPPAAPPAAPVAATLDAAAVATAGSGEHPPSGASARPPSTAFDDLPTPPPNAPRPADGAARAAEPAAAGPDRPAAARPSGSPFLADHAVSIVLYLGAFLVVAAVVIFLSYSWGDISGGGKLGVLAGLTAGFLAAAAVCLPRPSVRPAGRTFLALGAILVPANVAATYLVYFEDSAIPGAVFWFVGAVISGGLHGLLSHQLRSKAYGALAVLAVPVAGGAVSWLIEPRAGFLGPAGALALIILLTAVRTAPPIPLVQAARGLGTALLPLGLLAALPFVEDRDADRWGPVVALPLVTLGLAWEALRGGRTWWLGAAGLLLMAPFVALATAFGERQPWFALAAATPGLIAVATARVLPRERRLAWDVAALGPALLYPFVAWEQDAACLVLFSSLAVACAVAAWGWRSTLPLYVLVLGVDGAYVKLLAVYGAPNSPEWTLGAALWPLGIAWMLFGLALVGRRGGPGWFGALVTLAVSALLLSSQPGWSAGVAATGALASVLAAWRLQTGLVLPLAVPWLLVAGYQGGDVLGWHRDWRFVLAGLTGWLLVAVSLARGAAPARPAGPAPAEPSAVPPSDAGPDPAARSAASGRHAAARTVELPAIDWGLAARLSALAVAGFATALLLAVYSRADRWHEASAVAWLNVALVLAAWAALARSREIAIGAALAVVPGLLSAIARLHPNDAQAYALPIGGYLLALAAVARWLRGRRHREVATAIAAVGLLVLLGVGVIQSLDRGRFVYALLTFGEGLALVGLGIAIRWRVLVVGGVAGVVAASLRQLFDAVAALPGWAILGGSGMLLLGTAVALLLLRARLLAAGRSAAERWSGWD